MVVDSRANKSVVVQSMILGHENKRQKLYVGVGVSVRCGQKNILK